MSTLRIARFSLWGLTLVAVLAWGWFLFLKPRLEGEITDTLGRGDYSLAQTDGGTFTEASLRGKPSAIFFGFTHCPDVCPTTLGDIETWTAELGPAAADMRFWFATVDPARDTADLLRDYLSWTPNVTGLTGSPEEVAKAISAFKVFARQVPLEDGDYTMDHSSYVMLFDGDGRFDQVIAYQEAPDLVVEKLRGLIDRG